jgi:hypothetical protein
MRRKELEIGTKVYLPFFMSIVSLSRFHRPRRLGHHIDSAGCIQDGPLEREPLQQLLETAVSTSIHKRAVGGTKLESIWHFPIYPLRHVFKSQTEAQYGGSYS